MGCCEIRDQKDTPKKVSGHLKEKPKKNKPKDLNEIEHETTETLPSLKNKENPDKYPCSDSDKLSIPHSSSVHDPMFLDILEYIKTIDKLDGWKVVKSEENLMIQFRMGSKYSPDFYVSKLEFYFESIVPAKLILDQINDDKQRKSWDKNFTEFTNIENSGHEFILYTVVSVLTFKTESLEKKMNLYDDNRVYIIGYSINDNRKPITNTSRSHTFFTVSCVFEKNGRTGLAVYSQIDPKSFLAKKAISVYAVRLNEWAAKLKKQIEVLNKITI